MTSKNPNSNVAVPREVVGNYVQLQSEIDENLRILGTDPTMIRLNDSRAVRQIVKPDDFFQYPHGRFFTRR